MHGSSHISSIRTLFPFYAFKRVLPISAVQNLPVCAWGLVYYEVADLCLGKPPLKSLSISATIRDALSALKSSEDTHISIWNLICYLCKKDNIKNPSSALDSPVFIMLSRDPGIVRHVESATSLVAAIDLIIMGAQNLVVAITSRTKFNSKGMQNEQKHLSLANAGHGEFCWVTQEDVIRFLLSSITLFSPTATCSIESLGLIDYDYETVNYNVPASVALGSITKSLVDQTSVAVIDDDGILIGEISPFTLAYCDESVAAAITTLSAGDLMSYIDCGGPPEDMIKLVEMRLKERNLKAMLDEYFAYSTGSSLVAVMMQGVAHRVSYVWVIEEDCSVVGIVKFSGILEVFREHLESIMN
ncbi:Cystathionine beta-synthase, core [Artemisia annua]|uniref:Cystathionine beta-synthase, core n=1 Tax=Artemisia annua TaxID=35608 RepID=A0A2U1M549_ARTAN|nr:Cystathionine beta-synthase, core [Artemisia annua]